MNRIIFTLLFLSLSFSQNIELKDKVITKNNVSYECKVLYLSKNLVTVILKGGLESDLKISSLNHIFIEGFGDILISTDYFNQSIEKFNANRDKPNSLNESEYLPGDHEILLTSTAYTMPKGKAYFTDYELFFLNLTYAITDKTHLSFFTLFPITDQFLRSLTIGVKQNIFKSDYIAGSVSAAFIPETSNAYLGGTVSLGNIRNNLNVSIGKITDSEQIFLSLGTQATISKTASFLAEYISTDTGLSDDITSGLITLGVRLRSETMSWDIGGFRALNDDSDLLLFPILKATIVF